MSDLISRQSLKQKLQKHHDFFVDAYGGFSNLPQNDKSRVDEITNCIAMVVNEPSVAIPPVENKGEWLLYGYVSTKQIENCAERYCCSKCHNIISRDFRYFKFCPNCGAKMKGGE